MGGFGAYPASHMRQFSLFTLVVLFLELKLYCPIWFDMWKCVVRKLVLLKLTLSIYFGPEQVDQNLSLV